MGVTAGPGGLPVTEQTDTFSGRTPPVAASSQKEIVADSLAALQAALAGRYAIEREIGRGGMAIVYLARDVKHDRFVALKRLRPELAASLGPVRFLHEIHIAAALQHPHILPLYDSGEAADSLYYVMPFIEGAASLRDRLEREKQLPLDDALQIAREVAEGLSYAHGQAVIHRDIKPENILFTGRHAVISDFGIARAVTVAGERITAKGLTVGTPDYMSPEQAGGDDVDPRSDVYSLGCVLYEMLAGEPPFTGPSEQAIIARVLSEQPRSLRVVRPTLPAAIERIVEKALAKVPADRFATAADFAEALRSREVGGRPERRRIWRRAAALTLFVALLVAGAAWLGWGRRSRTRVPTVATLDPTHIAVLYFEDISDSGRLAPVANGLTEDLIDQLTQVQALTVITPGGVAPFRGSGVAPDSIARTLKVGTIVAGSIARSQDQLRVSIRLVDGANGRQLYSQTITRPWGDLLQLEDSLSADLARFLRVRLGEAVQLRTRRSGTKSVEAWRVLQQGDALRDEARSLLRLGEDPAAPSALLLRADHMYVQAERLDPHWGVPIVERGRVALDLAELAPSRPVTESRRNPLPADPAARTLAKDEWLQIALGHAEDALVLNADDPQALALRGTARYRLWAESYVTDAESVTAAERDLRIAVERDPLLARAWYELSELLRFTARFAEADWAARRALEADAYLAEALRVYYTLFYTALNRERFEEAQSWCRIGQARYPEDPGLRDCEVRILGWSSRGTAQVTKAWQLIAAIEAGRPAEQSGELWADRRLLVAAILARSGMADSAHALIRQARAGDPADTAAAWMTAEEAYIRVLLGETDEALRLLARVVEAAGQMRPYLAVSPWFEPLRGDPRFQALVALPRSGY